MLQKNLNTILDTVINNGRIVGDTYDEKRASLIVEIEFECNELGLSPDETRAIVEQALHLVQL